MTCIGCNADLDEPAAFAIMSEAQFLELQVAPTYMGESGFHAGPVCQGCFADPSQRDRPLKAHFALPGQVKRMTELAGTTGRIGG